VHEEGEGWAGSDTNELTDPVTAQVRALDAINAADLGFRDAAPAIRDEIRPGREPQAGLQRKPEAGRGPVSRDLKLEALGRVLRREIPWRQHCHRADDIATALRIAEEFGYDLVAYQAALAVKEGLARQGRRPGDLVR